MCVPIVEATVDTLYLVWIEASFFVIATMIVDLLCGSYLLLCKTQGTPRRQHTATGSDTP